MHSWIVFSIISALLVAATSILEKQMLLEKHAMQFSASLAVVNALLTAPFLFFVEWERITPSLFAFLFILAVILATGFFFTARGVRHSPLSISAPLISLKPAVTAIIAFLLLGESLSLLAVLGLLLIVVGVAVLEHHHGVTFLRDLREIASAVHVRYLVGALLLFGACMVGERYLFAPLASGGLAFPVLHYLAIVNVLAAIISMLYLAFFHHAWRDLKSCLSSSWLPIVIIGLLTVAMRLSHGFALSFPNGKAGLVSSIKYTAAIFITFVGGELFHEEHVWRRLAASAFIVVGVVLIIL